MAAKQQEGGAWVPDGDGGAKLVPASEKDQHTRSVVAPRTSRGESQKDGTDGKFTYAGHTYYFDVLSEDGQAYDDNWTTVTAARINRECGFEGDDALTADDIAEGETPLHLPAVRQLSRQLQRERQETIILDAVRKWTRPENIDADSIAAMKPDERRVLTDFIIAYSESGVTAEEFFRLMREGVPQRRHKKR